MPYLVDRYPVHPLSQFYVLDNVFTPEEMDKISFLEELQQFERGKTGASNDKKRKKSDKEKSDPDYRNSKVAWIYPDQNSDFIFSKFSYVLSQVNKDHFMRDIHGFSNIQYTVYEEGGQYNWHWDVEMMSTKYIRKISAVIMISDPEEYEGGELEIIRAGTLEEEKIFCAKPKKGSIVFFGSWMLHRVRPITSGKRKSLVIWVMGEDRG